MALPSVAVLIHFVNGMANRTMTQKSQLTTASAFFMRVSVPLLAGSHSGRPPKHNGWDEIM